MRVAALVMLLGLSSSLFAQAPPRVRPTRTPGFVANVEAIVKQAQEEFGASKSVYQRDIGVLEHVRAADTALIDPMQPSNAIQKAYEELDTAKSLGSSDYYVQNGIIRAQHEVENARLSPATADFGHIRSVLAEHAVGPASRLVAREGAALQEQVLAWLRIEQLITDHLHDLSELSNQALRAAQQ
jgi:hypothetical protein